MMFFLIIFLSSIKFLLKSFSINFINQTFCRREMKRKIFETSFIFFYFLDVWKMLKDKKLDDVSRIIKEQPNLINSMRGDWERTFLMYAAEFNRKDIVEYLSNQQQDLSVVDDYGENVLHCIVRYNDDDDFTFEMLNSLDISQLDDDVINKQNNYKRTPLHYAAIKNNHKSIVWLMDQGADPSLKDQKQPPRQFSKISVLFFQEQPFYNFPGGSICSSNRHEFSSRVHLFVEQT